MPTTNWDSERLDAFSAADGLHVAPVRDDGATYGTLTWTCSTVSTTPTGPGTNAARISPQ